ncbi:heme ABC transporter substrate-binding protein IsdE [Merdimonas faecis]|uniref:heme ABC transporter substrate-binding protein IsdE n=1 Tax=Merdimonas faecis TaxID=1653435 RepID=UPI0023F8D9BB|nr:heme ABC transporter substrate-binding protein IsdE [Merdimonas faecis]
MMKHNWIKRNKRLSALAACAALSCSLLAGCVDQSGGDAGEGTADGSASSQTESVETMLEITDPEEKAAVEAAKAKVQGMEGEPRIIATSPSTAEICDRLELDLVGVCSSSISELPERYAEAEEVGTAMAPDMEIVASLDPDWILSPATLQADLQPKYEAIDTDWAFLNLRSVQGMYRSIQELGEIFGREEQAQAMVDEFTEFYEDYKDTNEGKEAPKVLILMGLPGSYIIATENSYVGSLVELAGGENVYAGTDQEFLTVNTEDMKTKEPDVILRAAHALPDQIVEMFNEEFATDDIWQHFDAVKNERVYDLTYEYFGMSADFDYPEALEELQPMLYPESEEDQEKAKENSENAAKAAEESEASEKVDEETLQEITK